MFPLLPAPSDRPLRVLCLGAHPDDVEIGAGATLLHLQRQRRVQARVVIFSATDERRREQEAASAALFAEAEDWELEVHGYRESFFPDQWADIKTTLHESASFAPDMVFTHRLDDRHQDHATIAEITWHSFRDHLILQYEIPKYEGDIGGPNLFVPIDDDEIARKVTIIRDSFVSQASKPWFDADTFRGLARVRGVECNRRWAEAFHVDKMIMTGDD